jgi:hypothetical protein
MWRLKIIPPKNILLKKDAQINVIFSSFNELLIQFNDRWNIHDFIFHNKERQTTYTLGLVIGQALVIGQVDVFLSYFAVKL